MLCIVSLLALSASTKAQYIDLTTGKPVVVIKNNADGMIYDTETQRALYIYINPTTNDTFYGRTGEIINGKIRRIEGGKYWYEGDSAFVYDNGSFRPRRDSDGRYKRFDRGDGDVIITGDNYKKKTELDGDVKVKDNGSKVKLEGEGVIKAKDGDYRLKQTAEGYSKEKDANFKMKKETDGSMKMKDKSRDYKGKVDEKGNLKEKKEGQKTKLENDGKGKMKTTEKKVKLDKEGEIKEKPKD